MIQFSCRCKHIFDLPEEMAGQQVQCPNCMLLVDVPTHDELMELSEDGTFRLERPVAEDPQRLAELKRAFSRKRVDDQGVDIDLRLTPRQIAAAGTDDAVEFAAAPIAPKYDPETGELVRPLEIREEGNVGPHPSEIPFAKSALNYATPELNPDLSLSAPLFRLLMPLNLAAMFFILVAHVFLIMAMFSMFLAIFAILIVGVGLIAHYANVIEEVAIEERDELPRFLRHFNIADDVWLPFVNVGLAWVICFGPGLVVELAGLVKSWPPIRLFVIKLVFDIGGLIFFPSVVLTTTTSGTMSNLRPDRVLGTIARIGARYVLLVIIYAVAITLYYFGMKTTVDNFGTLFFYGPSKAWFFDGLMAYGILVTAIFLMHYFAWILGLCYRAKHYEFPWVFQHHVRTIPGVTAPRYAGAPRPPQWPRV
jgi:hypothetical protein